jgi:dihydrofolate reductase
VLTLIVARAHGGAIGQDGTIPWHAPEDLAFFQRETTGGAVIMGRRTWESLPFKPLKGRLNLVVSSTLKADVPVFRSVGDAVSAAYADGHRRVYGIGGEGIYNALLPSADRLLITEVDMAVAAPDAFFADVQDGDWDISGSLVLRDAPPRCLLYEFMRRR